MTPGWYFLKNTKSAHWFEDQEAPVCGRKRVGTLTDEEPSLFRKEAMTKTKGGCAACLKVLNLKQKQNV